MCSEYNDSVDQAAQVARAAIPLAAKLNLPINPIIFTVFYQHVAKLNEELSNAFENLIAQPDPPCKNAVESLYQQYIYKNDAHALETLRVALGSMIMSTHDSISRAEGESKAYEQSLGNVSEQLLQDNNFDSIESIIANLLSETNQMNSISKKLRGELQEANKKIDEMHCEFKRIRHESMTDPLTGLKNRRAFDQEIDELCRQAASDNEHLSLLLVDIDHFKKINDSYGHLLGDAVLKWVAQLLRDTVRGTDIIARFGGEEFVLLLPNTDIKGAESVAENVCNNIAKRNLRHSEKIIGKTTVSVGVAEFHHSETIEHLLQRADQALYQAKKAGRNCVVVNRDAPQQQVISANQSSGR